MCPVRKDEQRGRGRSAECRRGEEKDALVKMTVLRKTKKRWDNVTWNPCQVLDTREKMFACVIRARCRFATLSMADEDEDDVDQVLHFHCLS